MKNRYVTLITLSFLLSIAALGISVYSTQNPILSAEQMQTLTIAKDLKTLGQDTSSYAMPYRSDEVDSILPSICYINWDSESYRWMYMDKTRAAPLYFSQYDNDLLVRHVLHNIGAPNYRVVVGTNELIIQTINDTYIQIRYCINGSCWTNRHYFNIIVSDLLLHYMEIELMMFKDGDG